MQDSITMAEVGSMVKVSGNRIATPLGPPRPGSTPTKMPSTSPTIISAMIFHVIRTAKPCSNNPKASMKSLSCSWNHASVAEGRLKRSLGHDDVKRDVERHEHQRGENEGGQQRLPQRDFPDQPHEAGDQQEARDIHSEKLRGETEQQRRNEHRHHAAKLRARYKSLCGLLARQQHGDQPVQAGGAEND